MDPFPDEHVEAQPRHGGSQILGHEFGFFLLIAHLPFLKD